MGNDLAGTVALITGAASGIGAATAERLGDRGAKLALVDRDRDSVLARAEHLGGHALVADVSDAEEMSAAVAQTERELGMLDLVLLNAGSSGRQTGLDGALDVEAYRRLVGVNVDHVVFGVSAAVPVLRRAGAGTIAVTASLAGLTPMPGDPLYTLTKHAVVGYVRAIAPALAQDGIRALALCPGFADTPLLADERDQFGGFPLLSAGEVADGFELMLAQGAPGQAWFVQPGRPAAPYAFRGVPGPASGESPPSVSFADS